MANIKLNPNVSTFRPAVDRSNAGSAVRPTQLAANDGNDKAVREVAEKVGNLVNSKFGGDYNAAFKHYANGGSEVSRDGVKQMLSDAGVGSWATRGLYTDGLMKRFDTNANGAVSMKEFQSGLKAATGNA